MGLVSELRRRNVLRMAVLYAVAAWLIMQVVEVMMSVFITRRTSSITLMSSSGLPGTAMRSTRLPGQYTRSHR